MVATSTHWQFLGLVIGCVGWILTMVTAGQNEWRIWYVEDVSNVASGTAWVGVWRACFYSHTLPDFEFCRSIGITDPFIPLEIPVSQVMVMVTVILGLTGNMVGAYAVRNIYFGEKTSNIIRLLFTGAGVLYVLTGASCLMPLIWNMTSILTNQTITFPPEFHLPPAPTTQKVGVAIWIGISASILLFFSGILFLCYSYPTEASRPATQPTSGDKHLEHGTAMFMSKLENGNEVSSRARDNIVFQAEEDL
ncbi:claudin-34 isoform X2 [Esox lucius]|uniref:claudin-34 isoform X2 n=1 Tax=Esox lucius TaxID=8010 RepID=UPI0009731BB4|nr:claudin-34 isoform X2 [Esox lucius]